MNFRRALQASSMFILEYSQITKLAEPGSRVDYTINMSEF
jgi:hypothetical protein